MYVINDILNGVSMIEPNKTEVVWIIANGQL